MSGLLPLGQPYESEILLQDMILCYYKQKTGVLFPRWGEKKHRDVMVTRSGQLVIAEAYKTLFLFDLRKAATLKSKKIPTEFNNTRSLLTIKFQNTHLYLVLIDEKITEWMSLLQKMAVGGGQQPKVEQITAPLQSPICAIARPRPSFYNPRGLSAEDSDLDEEKENIYDFMEAVRSGQVEFFDRQQGPPKIKRGNSKLSANFRRLVSKISFKK